MQQIKGSFYSRTQFTNTSKKLTRLFNTKENSLNPYLTEPEKLNNFYVGKTENSFQKEKKTKKSKKKRILLDKLKIDPEY